MFLAMLELVRHHRVQAEQNELFGEIWLLPGTETAALDLSQIDTYEHSRSAGEAVRNMVNNLPVKTLVHKELTIEGYSARGGANLLADSRVQDRLRSGGPALVVHGHAHLVRLAHALDHLVTCRSTSPGGG